MDCRHLPGDPADPPNFDWDSIFPPQRRPKWQWVFLVLASLGLVPALWRVWRTLPDRQVARVASGWTDAELWQKRHEILRRAVNDASAARLAPLLRRIDRMARELPRKEADSLMFWKTFAVLQAGGVPADVPETYANTRRLLKR